MNRAVASLLTFTLLALFASPGCRGDASDRAAEAVVDAGPPPPPFDITDDRVDVVRVQTGGPGGEIQEVRGPLPEVPLPVPADLEALRLETWQRLSDFRVRLVDDRDRLVAYELRSGPVATRSDSRPEPGGTWLELTPREPLTVGDVYQLKLEGERSEHLTDADGKTYDDLAVALEPTAPEPETGSPGENGEAEDGEPPPAD